MSYVLVVEHKSGALHATKWDSTPDLSYIRQMVAIGKVKEFHLFDADKAEIVERSTAAERTPHCG